MSTEIVKNDQAKVAKGRAAKAALKPSGAVKPSAARVVPSNVVAKVAISEPTGRANKPGEIPDGLAKKYYLKSTFNTSDIMHSPVEKTLRMLDKILSGERLFTM